jgi:hypothetical protein
MATDFGAKNDFSAGVATVISVTNGTYIRIID